MTEPAKSADDDAKKTRPPASSGHERLFEQERHRLRRIAYQMLGSLPDADDIVQDAWLRFDRARTAPDQTPIEDVPAWLTTVTSRLALDALRRRKHRHMTASEPLSDAVAGAEDDMMLADSVGLALLVVLATLAPSERVAFVLHDAFGLSFDQIAVILQRSPGAARQAASRARRRVRSTAVKATDRPDRDLVKAFMLAARDGNVAAIVALLDPEVTLLVDPVLLPAGAPASIHGPTLVASRARLGAVGSSARLVLIGHAAAIAVTSDGTLNRVLTFIVQNDRIARIDVIAAPDRLSALVLREVDEG